MQSSSAAITINRTASGVTVALSGDCRLENLSSLESSLRGALHPFDIKRLTWQMADVRGFDSAAAMMVMHYSDQVEAHGGVTQIDGLSSRFMQIMQLVSEYRRQGEPLKAARENWLERLGRDSCARIAGLRGFFAFFGQASYVLMLFLTQLRMVRYREILFEMHESAIKALGIIALTTFLIGVVVAYQSAVQLKLYGANIFIVDMIGIAVLRELAPLITAIVVAGRSGSAYAAQIGVMKITEELDAMRTMGFDPFAFLVLPRMIALSLMMPLMIFFADVMGVLGGMLIANVDLGLSVELFLDRFANVIDFKHYLVGVVKGPFFAMLIASIGVYRGLKVKNDTQSIGMNTTSSVVEAIFAVIICDALFSIMFTRLGI